MDTTLASLFAALPSVGYLILGLMVGSFLNVAIARLPKMLASPSSATPVEGNTPITTEPFNLATPASHCPHCGHRLRAWENIPLLSFAWQRGRCTGCGHAISWRYVIVEALTGMLFWLAAACFVEPWPLVAAWVFVCAMVVLAVMELEGLSAPETLTRPLLWLGLAANLIGLVTDLGDAVVGAMLGFAVASIAAWVWHRVRGQPFLRSGDSTLLAAIGAWLGAASLPTVLLIATITAAVTAGLMRFSGQAVPRRALFRFGLPVGSFLAGAGVFALLSYVPPGAMLLPLGL